MCARRVLRAGLSGDTLKGPLTRRQKVQHDLCSDPMPDRVEPCLARLASKAPAGADWAFEVKWDGYRLAVHIERSHIRIITRGGHDWTNRFPTIVRDILDLGVDSAILDGEAVVLDERGAADFGALQRALGGRGGKRPAAEAVLYVFDLLYLDGQDLRILELEERRQMLEQLIGSTPPGAIRFSEEIDAEDEPFLRQACNLGVEGIIAKRRDAPYHSGRGGDWLKIKCIQSAGFAIIGYEPSLAAPGGIGRLLLGAMHRGALVYVGGVGTGFTPSSGAGLRKQMAPLVIEKPATTGTGRRKESIWIKPELVAEIAFGAWSDDGKLRHASYKGLHDRADEANVFEMR